MAVPPGVRAVDKNMATQMLSIRSRRSSEVQCDHLSNVDVQKALLMASEALIGSCSSTECQSTCSEEKRCCLGQPRSGKSCAAPSCQQSSPPSAVEGSIATRTCHSFEPIYLSSENVQRHDQETYRKIDKEQEIMLHLLASRAHQGGDWGMVSKANAFVGDQDNIFNSGGEFYDEEDFATRLETEEETMNWSSSSMSRASHGERFDATTLASATKVPHPGHPKVRNSEAPFSSWRLWRLRCPSRATAHGQPSGYTP
eukprot:TRINITY_DN76875_c0_g1_i1.p1 TRINITY_DN76875_c0_g1~~TRINITY_DN76875_c0_g1_i1.p1  ORF type:complete len:270 (-),score=40.14 TRINITY_DN76875_c0_g1_i1:54-821(-)